MLTVFFLSSFLVIGLGSLPLWRLAILRLQKHQSIVELRERVSSPFGLIDVAIMFLTWVIGQAMSVGIAAMVLESDFRGLEKLGGTETAILMCVVAVGQFVFTGIGMFLIWMRYHHWEIFGVQKSQFSGDVRIGMLAFVMVVPAILLLQWALTFLVPYEHLTLELLSKNGSLLTILSTWLTAVLVAPICEEVFFRGILQSWLQRLGHRGNARFEQTITGGWGSQEAFEPAVPALQPAEAKSNFEPASLPLEFDPCVIPGPILRVASLSDARQVSMPLVKADSSAIWMPIIVSAAVFGLAHVGQGAAPIPLFVFGLALGYLYRQTGRILPCIVLHMGLNGFSMFWFTLQILFPESDVLSTIPLSE